MAKCSIPLEFFEIHGLLCGIMGVSVNTRGSNNDTGIEILVYGDLLEKTKKKSSEKDYTLTVKPNNIATINAVYFDNIPNSDGYIGPGDIRGATKDVKKFEIAVPESMTLELTRGADYSGVSEYDAKADDEKKIFVYKDTDFIILKWLVHLWRKRYYYYKPIESNFKNFEDFFREFEKRYGDNRDYEYSFEVERIKLSSSYPVS
jgi:hypothetical protein